MLPKDLQNLIQKYDVTNGSFFHKVINSNSNYEDLIFWFDGKQTQYWTITCNGIRICKNAIQFINRRLYVKDSSNKNWCMLDVKNKKIFSVDCNMNLNLEKRVLEAKIRKKTIKKLVKHPIKLMSRGWYKTIVTKRYVIFMNCEDNKDHCQYNIE